MHINKKLAFIIFIAITLRLGLLYCNYIKHPSFFDRSPEKIQAAIYPDSLPYLNTLGYELGNIACSIVCKKEGFSSPFGGSTGPSAWSAPGPAMLYSLIFKLFGCFSNGALLAMFGIAMLLSIILIISIHSISLQLFKSSTGALLSALVFAVSVQDIEIYFQGFNMDFNISSFFFILVFYMFYRYYKCATLKNLLLFSICAGISMLFYPTLISSIVLSFALNIVLAKQGRRRALADLCLSLAVICCIIGPYIFYQKGRVGSYGFIKSNGAFEIHQGNTPFSDGYLTNRLFKHGHPSKCRPEFEAYSRLGEAAYVESKKKAFLEEFDLVRFLRTTSNRFLYFFFVFRSYLERVFITPWMILRLIGHALPGICLLVFPLLYSRSFNRNTALVYTYVFAYALPYLLVAVMYRYSAPINTLTAVLLGSILCKLFGMHSSAETCDSCSSPPPLNGP